jgi:hypothetical protein
MNFAYGWAFSKPVRKVFYNITITGLSVAVALVIGTIELGGLIASSSTCRAPSGTGSRHRHQPPRLRHRRHVRRDLGDRAVGLALRARIEERWAIWSFPSARSTPISLVRSSTLKCERVRDAEHRDDDCEGEERRDQVEELVESGADEAAVLGAAQRHQQRKCLGVVLERRLGLAGGGRRARHWQGPRRRGQSERWAAWLQSRRCSR